MSSLALPVVAAPRWNGRHRPGVLLAIVLLHLLLAWALTRLPAVRDALDLAPAPLTVRLIAQAPAPVPGEAPTLRPPAARPPHAPPPLPVPEVAWSTPAAAPAAPDPAPAEQAAPAAAPAPVTVAAVAAVAPQAPLPSAERDIAISQVEYLSPPTLVYPLAARRLRQQGLVQVRVRVDEQGRPERFEVVRSSGHPVLDDAALATVRATRFKPYAENGRARPFWVVMPLQFQLTPPGDS